jgi:hypothetical protein
MPSTMPSTITLPALRPGERVQLWSDAEPYDDRPWCWSLHAPGREPAQGAAGTQAGAVAALAAALEAVRKGAAS